METRSTNADEMFFPHTGSAVHIKPSGLYTKCSYRNQSVYIWNYLKKRCSHCITLGKDYSGAKLSYIEPISLSKANSTKRKAFDNKTLHQYNHSQLLESFCL